MQGIVKKLCLREWWEMFGDGTPEF